MYRAAFLAFGVYLLLSGAGLLFIDEVALSKQVSRRAAPVLSLMGDEDPEGRYHLQPPDWFPFTSMGLGIVTMLYAIALPKS